MKTKPAFWPGRVRTWLEEHPGWHTPTEIGVGLGLDYYEASGRVAASLRRLGAEGLVERRESPVGYRRA